MADRKLTVRNLSNQIKQRTRHDDWQGTKKEIKDAEDLRKQIIKQNREKKKRMQDILEEKAKGVTDKKRAEYIEKFIKNKKNLPISTREINNYINMLHGKDFYHVIDNGFTRYRVKNSVLVKKENIGLFLVEKLITDIEKKEKEVKEKLKDKKISKVERQRLNAQLKGIIKLYNVAISNREALKNNDFENLEEGQPGEEAYEITSEILGENIRL